VLCGKKKFCEDHFVLFIIINRSKDDVVLSVNEEISGDRKKYEITGKYDLIIKSVVGQDSGRYLCQNFDQGLSINVLLTVLSKYMTFEQLDSYTLRWNRNDD
jgi:hypothetical protein